MVKDTCFRTGFVPGYQTVGHGGSRNQHSLKPIQQTWPTKHNKKPKTEVLLKDISF